MKLKHFQLALLLVFSHAMTAQVKIGERSEQIDPASLLELESQEKVLVITRLSTSQMESITPLNGALVYNTDESCLFYHNGQRWINLCEALGLAFTNEPIVNQDTTIIITEFEDRVNFEVGQIRGENIVDFSIGSQEIQNNSINLSKLADASVDTDKLTDNAVTAAKIGGDVAGNGLIQNAGGALEVDVTGLEGDGNIISSDLVVGGDPNSLFGDVTLEIADNAVTAAEIDLVDVTLSDFVNDVPFLEAEDLIADNVQYDGAASGLAATNVQDAIDQLILGADLPFNITLEVVGDELVLTDFGGALDVPLADINNQDIFTDDSPGNISLSNGGSELNLNVDDGDADDTNELSDLELNGNLLTLTNGQTGAIGVDLTPYINTDNQNIATTGDPGNISIDNGDALVLNVNDGDPDPENEIELPVGGTNGQVLATDGSGTYTWIENSAAINTDGTSILGDGVTAPLTVGEISGGTAGNIADNSLTQEDIGNNAVGESELADQAVTPTKVQPGEEGQV
ncbi:MAG: hypothetical protein P8X60_08610, partial [Robiginitalea sp.]